MIKRSYWDIDDILAEEELITIQVNQDLEGFGFLNPGSDSLDLKESFRLTVPL